ncbi:unnamed protein product [Amoebophrya sp. A120]|nr:unnamed protein product [Amoebophrya sp. A120]|eukprot:GSA120T00021911001.1
MTSKFFGGNSSSDSDSDSSRSSDDEKPTVQKTAAQKAKQKIFDSDSDSDDDKNTKRVIRSHADKRYAGLQELIRTMKNHLKISDYSSLLQDYEGGRKMLDKIKTQAINASVSGQKTAAQETPKFFIKAIATLAEHVENTHAGGEKKLFSKNKATAFNTLRAKIRKGNVDFETELEHYAAHPDEYEDEPEEEVEEEADDSGSSSSDSDDGSPTSEKKGGAGKGSDDSDSESDSDSDSDSDDSSSAYTDSSESSEDSDMDEEMIRMRRRRRWLKTEADYEAERREKEQRERVAALAAARAAKKKMQTDAGHGKKQVEGKMKDADDAIRKSEDPDGKIHEIKTVDLLKKILDLVQVRGRKGLDRQTYLKKLDFYLNVVTTYKHGAAAQLFLLGQKVIFEFDSYSGAWFENLMLNRWENAMGLLREMFDAFKGWEQTDEEKGKDAGVEADDDQDDTFTKNTLWRTFLLSVFRLDDELFKALQFSTKEMQDYLVASCKQILFLKDLTEYMVEHEGEMKSQEQGVDLSKTAARLLEHIYYKQDSDNKICIDFMKSELGMDVFEKPSVLGSWGFSEPGESFDLIDTLCDIIETGCEGQITEKVFVLRAELCRAYHKALHNQFRAARDTLHYMTMYERSLEVETHTQILYNRAFAQTGLCAFRMGLIPEAHHYLMELCTYNKSKELLAQGVAFQRFNERNPEQEKTERRRQLPYHMHIPLDHLDAAHLVTALLLEVPNMLLQQLNPGHRRLISRALRKHLDQMEKHVFQTPPETTREYILHAALAVMRGDWKSAVHQHLAKVQFLPDLIDMKLLEQLVKEQAIRCYCLKHSSSYESLDLKQLTEMFELPKEKIHSICSRMINDQEVPFAWDKTSSILIVRPEDSQTNFQRLALTLADKCSYGLDQHERAVDYKTGHYQKNMEGGQGGQGYGNNRGQNKGEGGFRDIYSEDVRHFNRTRYANAPRQKGGMGIVTANSKGFKGKGKGGKGKGKGQGKQQDGMRVRMGGWNRGLRDNAVGFSFKPGDREGRSVWA